VKPDVIGRTYTDVATAGGGAGTVTVTGYSLSALLSALKIPPSSFTYAEVPYPDGRAILITNTQAIGGAAYPDGPPVVWQDGAGAHFLEPSLPPGGGPYAGQTFASPSITIDLHSGTLLSVGISNSRAYVGKPVVFTSSVGGAAGGSLSYEWSLGDGGLGSSASVTHTYTAPGTYDVYLKVSGGLDAIGESAVLPLVVGEPPPAPPRPGGGTGAGQGGTGSGTGTGGSGTGSGSSAASGIGAVVTPTAPATPRIARHAPVKKVQPPTGPVVSGILIADVTRASGGGSQGGAGGSRASRGGQQRAAALAEWFWIALVALLVLGGGALLEWAGSPRLTAILGITPSVEAYSRER
jgi:hypothetical protein